MPAKKLRVVLIKPSKYEPAHRGGYVQRFRKGFMPNSTLPFIRSMTPDEFDGIPIEVFAIDEYVQTDLGYLELLKGADCPVLLALVGTQSHQFQRALDLALFAKSRGVDHCIIGGPHPMTCDTTLLHARGVSFALAEAELIWPSILHDAVHGQLRPVYGQSERWQRELDSPVLIPPSRRELRRHVVPMLGIYPARGCPYSCNFCSVIKIAGHKVRSQTIATTIESLRAAKQAGVRMIMFTSDNFNKYPEAAALLQAMIDEKVQLPFFVQCDAQITRDEALVELLGRAGCFQMFVGVESFDRAILKAAKKFHNKPETYGEIVRLCEAHGITSHFSNIIGFPEQDEAMILEHLSVLRKLRPAFASFYILGPIPGTEQYDDFLRDGLITENNLDRFDTLSGVWRHPRLSESELEDLWCRCYREFFALRDIGSKHLNPAWRHLSLFLHMMYIGTSLFSRFSAWRRIHPMAGGIGQVGVDAVSDYIGLRRAFCGSDLLPLPASLSLSQADEAFNRQARSTLTMPA